MSSLLTSDALVQKCYTKTPVGINRLVKLNGFNLEYNVPIVELVSGSSNATVIGLTTEIVSASGVVTEVLYKGLVDATGLLPTGTFVNSEIYWNSNTLELTSDTTDYFVGWVSEAFPNQKIYVDILKSSGGGGSGSVDWDDIQNKPTEFNPTPHGHTIANISGLQAALNNKRNTGNIPALEIITSQDFQFSDFREKRIWNNTQFNFGLVDITNQHVTENNLFVNVFGFNCFLATLGINVNLVLDSPREGQVYVIKFIQDATGGRTVTLPGNCIVATGESIDTGANKKSLLMLHYDGTEFLCSWKKGF